MSYLKQTMYNIMCDSCGTKCDQETWYADRDELEMCRETSEWITIGRKHYCPDCYQRDDNDNITITLRNGNSRP